MEIRQLGKTHLQTRNNPSGFTMTGLFKCDDIGHVTITWDYDGHEFRLVHFQIADPSFDMSVAPHDLEPDLFGTQSWRMLSDEKITGEAVALTEVATNWLTARNLRGPKWTEAFNAAFDSLKEQYPELMATYRQVFDSDHFAPFTQAQVKALLTAEVHSHLVETGVPNVNEQGAALRGMTGAEFAQSVKSARKREFLKPARKQGKKPEAGAATLTDLGTEALAKLRATYNDEPNSGWTAEELHKIRLLIDQHGPPLPLTPGERQQRDTIVQRINDEERATADRKRRRENQANISTEWKA